MPHAKMVTVYYQTTSYYQAQIGLNELTELALEDGEFRAPAPEALTDAPYGLISTDPKGNNEPGDALSTWLLENGYEVDSSAVIITEISSP